MAKPIMSVAVIEKLMTDEKNKPAITGPSIDERPRRCKINANVQTIRQCNTCWDALHAELKQKYGVVNRCVCVRDNEIK